MHLLKNNNNNNNNNPLINKTACRDCFRLIARRMLNDYKPVIRTVAWNGYKIVA
jgi:hypothetical protein